MCNALILLITYFNINSSLIIWSTYKYFCYAKNVERKQFVALTASSSASNRLTKFSVKSNCVSKHNGRRVISEVSIISQIWRVNKLISSAHKFSPHLIESTDASNCAFFFAINLQVHRILIYLYYLILELHLRRNHWNRFHDSNS